MSKTTLPDSPYKGLIPYSEEEKDASFFFGREADRKIITANLMASRLTLLYGPSGVGKSSVLRAGVAYHLLALAKHNLKEQGEAEFAVVVFSEWRDNPLAGLAAQVQESVARTLGESAERVSTNGNFSGVLETSANRIGGRLLIILDQFEEYFLYHAQEDGAGTFADEFPRAVNNYDLPVSFMISIREDALAKLDRFEGRIPNLFDNYLRVEHLDRNSAREAIVKPLDQYNRLLTNGSRKVSIEPELVEEVLDQVQTGKVVLGEAGRGVVEKEDAEAQIETPFLQLVMTRLWNEEMREGSRVLRLETLNNLGGAKSIIKTHLDEAMGGLKIEDQDIAARIFRYLVTPSGTKIALSLGDLAKFAKLRQEQLAPVLEELSSGDNRILRPVAPPPDDPGPYRYEIFHDVLAPAILGYADARERVETEKQLAYEQRLVRRQRWGLAAMTLLLLMMIGAIIYAFQQKAEANTQKNNAQAALAELYRTQDGLRDALKIAEEQRTIAVDGQGEAERQKTAAETAKADAQKQRRAAEQSAAEAVAQSKAAEKAKAEVESQKDRTQKALDEAIVARDAADTAAREAGRQRLAAEAARKIAKSRELAASATALLKVDPELAVLLATEARKVTPTAQSDEALRQSLLELPDNIVIRGGSASFFNAVAFSPDSKLIVTGGWNDTMQIWDAATGQRLRELTGHKGGVISAAFSPDGKLIVTANWEGLARICDVSTGKNLRELPGTSQIFSVAFSPDGKLIVIASYDGTARIWDAATGQNLRELRVGGMVFRAAFSPDNKLIVTAGDDGRPRIWDASTGELLRELLGHKGRVFSAAFSPDGKYIVTGSEDSTARIWDAATGQSLRELQSTGVVLSAAFSPDGRYIVTAGHDKTARVYPLEMFAPQDTLNTLASARVKRKLTKEEKEKYLLEQ